MIYLGWEWPRVLSAGAPLHEGGRPAPVNRPGVVKEAVVTTTAVAMVVSLATATPPILGVTPAVGASRVATILTRLALRLLLLLLLLWTSQWPTSLAVVRFPLDESCQPF